MLFCLLAASGVSAKPLNLMTYNIRLDVASDGANAWVNRKDFLTSQISFYEPDIFGVQEAVPGQMADLRRMLPDYESFGIGREGGEKGEFSALFYLRSRFKRLDGSTFWLSETPDVVSKGWDASYLRVCTYALFYDKQSKKRFWVFNTHLDNNGAQAREKGVELILNRIGELNRKGYPVVFMGDLNSEPESKLILDLRAKMSDTRLASETKPFGPEGTFNGFKFDQPVERLIDYIFVSIDKKLAVRKYGVLSDSKALRYPSDHFPVFVTVEIGRK